jgi:predicted dehydrogenase
VATCDRNPRRAAALASKAHACFPTNELWEALSLLPDAVIVATPLRTLPEIATQSIRSGSHVFVDPGKEVVHAELDPALALAQASRKLMTISSSEVERALAGFFRNLRELLHD